MSILTNIETIKFERVVYITRMTAIGDVIITSRVITKLKANGYFPILVTSFATEEIARRMHDLKAYICIDKDNDIKCYYDSKILIKEHFCQKINSLKTYKDRIIIDLQRTRRSKRAKKLLKKELHLFFENSLFVNKRTLFRLFLIMLAYFSFGQKRRDKIKEIVRIHDLQDNLVDQILKYDKVNIKQPNYDDYSLLSFNKDYHLPLKNYICIFPGASGFIKMWPKENFRELIQLILINSNNNIIICGSKSEEFLGEYLAYPKNKRVLNLVNKTSLGETLDLISHANYIISNDSFAGHAADIYKKPASVIFGATSPSFGFVPIFRNITLEYENIACSPCTRHGQSDCHFKNLKCLKDISPISILQKMKNFF
ncbi:glycosyltransferase family 9 protein [Fluviispira sanaruensis]|uniref:Glycosyltransferase family 9 protein n=1 Tax=Fluviispira sanaruensis TaxID=2493639 RepID=A0A4P2VGR6_FLUSA|nr:glycosyltransferase family 9 protein [Fluviispira sanaruensis]BBH52006.1 glycosyltransferase family 9 protein [Fluviispira sanaruensis]